LMRAWIGQSRCPDKGRWPSGEPCDGHSGSMGTSKLQQSSICCPLHIGFLLTLLFEPEDGGDMLLRNVGWLSTDYTLLCSRRQKSAWTLFKERLRTGTDYITYSPRNIGRVIVSTVYGTI
jgi:hypothetical protein